MWYHADCVETVFKKLFNKKKIEVENEVFQGSMANTMLRTLHIGNQPIPLIIQEKMVYYDNLLRGCKRLKIEIEKFNDCL